MIRFIPELIITSGREVIVRHALAGEEACCVDLLFPRLHQVHVQAIERDRDGVLITARTRNPRRTDDLPCLHGFANGLERDLDAVTAGLTLPWSSGPVEGHVNRIKMIKRQRFGRAGFPLLRERVLFGS